jgi:calcium/calmodulin-dependent protein kinase kinase 2
MKAIVKFKSLLSPKDGVVPKGQLPNASHADTASPSGKDADGNISVAEEASRVLRDRAKLIGKAIFNRGYGRATPSPQETRRSDSDPPPLILGVGVGGGDDQYASGHGISYGPVEYVVADSPTAVDFSIYDYAFQEKVESIRRSASRRTARGPAQRGDRDRDRDVGKVGNTTMFHTSTLASALSTRRMRVSSGSALLDRLGSTRPGRIPSSKRPVV